MRTRSIIIITSSWVWELKGSSGWISGWRFLRVQWGWSGGYQRYDDYLMHFGLLLDGGANKEVRGLRWGFRSLRV